MYQNYQNGRGRVALARLRINSLQTVVASLPPPQNEPSQTSEFENALRNALSMLSEPLSATGELGHNRRIVTNNGLSRAAIPCGAGREQTLDR